MGHTRRTMYEQMYKMYKCTKLKEFNISELNSEEIMEENYIKMQEIYEFMNKVTLFRKKWLHKKI